MTTIKKGNIKKMIIDVENYEEHGGSAYVRFELDVDINNNESFGDFLWFGEKNKMEIEIDDLERYEDFEDEGIEDNLSREALEFIKTLKEEYNI